MRAGPRTDYVRCVFYAWEAGDGTPWIEFGYYQPGVPALEIMRLGLTFKGDVTPKQAEEMAQTLRTTFIELRCTLQNPDVHHY